MEYNKYSTYQDTYSKWLPSIPKSWQYVRLGQFFSERNEKVSDKDYPPLSVTMNGIVPQLETAAKTDAGDNRKKVCKGDFVINSRSDRKGSSGLSTLDGSVSLISIVLKPNGLDGAYIHHLLRSKWFQEEFYRFGKGIVDDLWSTKYSDMKSINIPIPSLNEQQAISTFLDRETTRIDALIEKKQRLIELLKEKRQAVITQAVTKGLDPNVPMKDSGVEWLGEVPEHWDVTRLGWLASSLTYGFTNPMPTEDNGPKMLTANDIGWGYVNYEAARSTSEQAYKRDLTDKSRPKKNDLLITKDGTLGRVALHDGSNACINQSVALLRPISSMAHPKFLATALLASVYQEKMIFDAGGTTIKHIYITRLAKMQVVMPPIGAQSHLVAQLAVVTKRLDSILNKTKSSIQLLKEHRSALITAAVTGQIDVRNLT